MIHAGDGIRRQPPSRVTTEIARLGAACHGPSWLHPAGTSVASGGAILELAPDLVPQLQGCGRSAADRGRPGKPMFAVGSASDRRRTQARARGSGRRARLGEACELASSSERPMRDTLCGPCPTSRHDRARDGRARDLVRHQLAVPEKIEVRRADVDERAALWGSSRPTSQARKLGSGRRTRASVTGSALPSRSWRRGERAIVSASDEGKPLAESAIGARCHDQRSVHVMTYDYGKFLELQSQLSQLVAGGPAAGGGAEAQRGLATLFAAAPPSTGHARARFWERSR